MAPDEQKPAPPEETPAPPDPRPRRGWRRYALHALAFFTAVFAAIIVTVFSIDLGPHVKGQAEKFGSNYLDRPMTIGKVKALLRPGEFEFEDVVIEGREPGDRPFLHAKKITVSLPWWTVFRRELIIESVDMIDWTMVIETWEGGRHNFPRVTGPKREPRPPGPKRFTTTLRRILAERGQVTYIDHATPWSFHTPDIQVTLFRRPFRDDYGGAATFENARIKIQDYEEFGAKMRSQFGWKGSRLHFDRIDLDSEGAQSVLTGDIQLDKWPEQLYQIRSKIDIATQKEIFFTHSPFEASGTADFEGTFHLFKDGRELKGSWQTPVAHVKIGPNTWRFPNLRGDVLWLPDRLEVTDARSGLLGGTAQFDYRILSLNNKNGPRRAIWTVNYRQVDLAQLTDFLELEGIRLAGTATGRNHLEWPLADWDLLRGNGEVTISPPADAPTMSGELRAEAVAAQVKLPPQAGPFNPNTPLGYVPLAGHLVYRLDPQWITLGSSWIATPKTHVSFDGRTAYYRESRIPFHVTSLDWQEADRVFAGVLTALGSPTGAIPIDGYGQFEGVMLGDFRDPRIEGTFTGGGLRAWGVTWGEASADVAIEDAYAHVSRSTMTRGESTIDATGTFSLGYPRRDRGEEINAKVALNRWPMVDLRSAFELHEWPIEGLVSGEFTVTGGYETPIGGGTLLVEHLVAYGEPFERATSSLRLEGNGVRLEKFEVQKSTGRITGAARVGWDGTYSFNADGEQIPVESLKTLEFPTAPLSGVMRFKADGTGTFDEPRYDVALGIVDLFAGDEGIGQLSGHLGLRGELLTVDFEAASPRLAVSGAGRIAMTDEMDAELTLRFNRTSLDPYLRFYEPRWSPFTTLVAGGTVRVTGELANPEHLLVEARVEDVDLTLFDYPLTNDGVIELALDRNVAQIRQLRLQGEGTRLGIGGSINISENTIDVNATGDANLGILQAFFRNLRSSGSAALSAGVTGSLDKPVFSGKATLANGRLRYFPMPRSLDALNGTVSFDAAGIRLDDVRGTLGGGDVTFGGRIAMVGFTPGELSLTAVGERMRLNYPEGFRSEIDADLALRGQLESPVLTGVVTLRDAIYGRRFETTPNLFNFGGAATSLPGTPSPSPTVPLRFDIQIDAPPGTIRVDNNVARLQARADLRLQGTYDRPILAGFAEIDRGDVVFEGNRYNITRGRIDFANPTSIEPYFDLEAETRARVADQTYRVTVGVVGTASRLVPTLTSDPPLATADIVAVLLGQEPNLQNAELRSLTMSTQSEAELVTALTGRLLASPFSAPVGRVAEEVLGTGTTVLISPRFGTEGETLPSSARLVIGKRLSDRAYITFVSPLGAGQAGRDQIITFEYDQSERISWIVTQIGDRTFALDFRVRRVF